MKDINFLLLSLLLRRVTSIEFYTVEATNLNALIHRCHGSEKVYCCKVIYIINQRNRGVEGNCL